MILDSRLAGKCDTARPFTLLAAVSNALDTIQVGSHLDVDALLDIDGRAKNLASLSMYVNKVKGGRAFSVRKVDGILARVYRSA
jgi:hypothetical protein